MGGILVTRAQGVQQEESPAVQPVVAAVAITKRRCGIIFMFHMMMRIEEWQA